MSDIYTISMIVSITTFILITHVTPGPTNIILLSSVLSHGYKKTLPFMIANIISYPMMMIFTGLGLGIVLTQNPQIMPIFKIFGVTYLCWMAWKIANDSGSINSDESSQNKPFSFWQGFIYPWINPKAWVIYTSTLSVFVTSTDESFLQISIIVFVIFIAMIITVYTWAFGGIILKRFIKNAIFIKRLNQIMALLLVASIVPIIV